MQNRAAQESGVVAAEAVAALTSAFNTHSLDEVGDLALMDRVDTKYLLPLAQLPELLMAMQEHYSLLVIGGRRALRYETVYLDTRAFALYDQHHGGRGRRMKVRLRTYVDTATRFLEVKRKNARRMTEKVRVSLPAASLAGVDMGALLQQLGVPQAEALMPLLSVDYWRLCLQSRAHGERVSIDIGLHTERLDDGRCMDLQDLAIVELKQGRRNRSSPVWTSMQRLAARPLAISKYCLATALLFPEQVRRNCFKPLLARVQPYSHLSPGGLVHVHS